MTLKDYTLAIASKTNQKSEGTRFSEGSRGALFLLRHDGSNIY